MSAIGWSIAIRVQYWSDLDISTRLTKIEVPALHISGWYDTYLEGSIAGYIALREHAGTAFARENQYLLAGPWVHIPWGDRIGDKANLGPEANLDTDALLLRWFNHWLKDSGEFANDPRVRHFVLGEKRMVHEADEWPTDVRRLRSICIATAMQIRARAMELLRFFCAHKR